MRNVFPLGTLLLWISDVFSIKPGNAYVYPRQNHSFWWKRVCVFGTTTPKVGNTHVWGMCFFVFPMFRHFQWVSVSQKPVFLYRKCPTAMATVTPDVAALAEEQPTYGSVDDHGSGCGRWCGRVRCDSVDRTVCICSSRRQKGDLSSLQSGDGWGRRVVSGEVQTGPALDLQSMSCAVDSTEPTRSRTEDSVVGNWVCEVLPGLQSGSHECCG